MRQSSSVLLTTEGTYPFHKGGVSTWCDTLTRHLPEIDFTLLAVVTNPHVTSRYTLSPNVRRVVKVPLWGLEEPAEYPPYLSFSGFLQMRWSTTPEVVAAEFIPRFAELLSVILNDDNGGRSADLGQILVGLFGYFQERDYHVSMTAEATWNCFRNELRDAALAPPHEPTIADVAEALRLLYRFLLVLRVPVPRTDLTHSTAAASCGIPCVIAKLRHRTPYLLTEHGIYLREQYLGLRRCVESAFVRWFLLRVHTAITRLNYHFADQISPVCAYNMRWERWSGADLNRIKVIYNGADPDVFRPAKVGPSKRPLVVSMGLIFPLKGQLPLIEAAALVRARRPDVEFRLYGEATDAEYLHECRAAVRRLGLESTVAFAGATREPWRAYNEADVVAFASLSEGHPYALIEAMLCGCCIVATDVGGVPEALGSSGVLVRASRPEEMADALLAVLENPEKREQFGRAARERAQQRFTRDTFIAAYRESYRALRVIGERGVGSQSPDFQRLSPGIAGPGQGARP